MGVKNVLRLHFPGGRKVSEPIARTARENRMSIPEARQLVRQWVDAGDLAERPDGGYDVVRYQGRTGG